MGAPAILLACVGAVSLVMKCAPLNPHWTAFLQDLARTFVMRLSAGWLGSSGDQRSPAGCVDLSGSTSGALLAT
jgi:hypothetical protein